MECSYSSNINVIKTNRLYTMIILSIIKYKVGLFLQISYTITKVTT